MERQRRWECSVLLLLLCMVMNMMVVVDGSSDDDDDHMPLSLSPKTHSQCGGACLPACCLCFACLLARWCSAMLGEACLR